MTDEPATNEGALADGLRLAIIMDDVRSRWIELAQYLPLRVQPIIERAPMPIPSLAVEFVSPFRDQDMQIIAGQHRLTCAWSIENRCLGWCGLRRSKLCLFRLA
jgi:hypothetical protein